MFFFVNSTAEEIVTGDQLEWAEPDPGAEAGVELARERVLDPASGRMISVLKRKLRRIRGITVLPPEWAGVCAFDALPGELGGAVLS